MPQPLALTTTDPPTNSNIGGFGAQGHGYTSPVTTMWSEWVVKYPCCHQMSTQTHPRVNITFSEKSKILKTFQVPLKSLSSSKTVKVLTGKGP